MGYVGRRKAWRLLDYESQKQKSKECDRVNSGQESASGFNKLWLVSEGGKVSRPPAVAAGSAHMPELTTHTGLARPLPRNHAGSV